ncbi:MAG: bifunctional molybdenum cofactor biosynthesis protein MoaC/MoaB [Chitinophagales bacterium]
MKDILNKTSTLRKATATAKLVLQNPAAMEAVLQKKVPKGDIFEFSRAAGLLAVKKTADVIPDCHPLPVEYAAIRFSTEGLMIHIAVEVHTVYKTGVEVEAMHGAAIVALTIYDMLKPLDKNIEIVSIRLEKKSGGKSDRKKEIENNIRCAVIVCSDSISKGEAKDQSGKAVIEKLKCFGIDNGAYEIIADDFATVQEKAKKFSGLDYELILFCGGTGLSPRDITPEAIEPLLDRKIPGIMEAARSYGQDRTPYAMLSRGVAGFIKNSLILTLPGSVSGASDAIDALFPAILHLFSVKAGERHEK